MDHDEFRHLSEHEKLDEIHRLLRVLVTGDRIIMTSQAQAQAAIDASIATTAAQTDVVKSAVLALDGITQRITDAVAAFQAANPGVDVSALNAATAAEAANTKALADAVAANTPAAPPAPTPAPAPTA